MYNLEPFPSDIAPSTCFLTFLLCCLIPWILPNSLLSCLISIVWFTRPVRLVPILIHFQIVIFASCTRLVTFILYHIWLTPLLNTTASIFVKTISSIMYVSIIVIRHKSRWALDMIISMMQIMNLSHRQIIPSGSHSWYSSYLMSVSMVASAIVEVFFRPFPLYSWGL